MLMPVPPVPVTGPMRIASVPSDHVYVRHLEPTTGPGRVVRLPDPPVPGAPAGQWWPSPVLDPAWLRAHADEVDVLHVHFGFEHLSPTRLHALVSVLQELRVPLVLTVHDLHNPHLVDQRAHSAALDVLVPAAAALITLTPGAAAEIARRWHRRAVVLAHPHVVDLARLARPRPHRAGFVVGLHAKRRANCDPGAVRPGLLAAVAALPGARLQPDPEPGRRLSDDELWDHLAGLDALVLPYTHATHSGFVEACHDLGTAVLAPRVGYLAEQQEVHTYDTASDGTASDGTASELDGTASEPVSLLAALRRVRNGGARRPADPGRRRAQRDAVAAAHAELYAGVLAA